MGEDKDKEKEKKEKEKELTAKIERALRGERKGLEKIRAKIARKKKTGK